MRSPTPSDADVEFDVLLGWRIRTLPYTVASDTFNKIELHVTGGGSK